MKNLIDLSLRNKLVLLVVLPLSVLLYFLQKTILSEFDRKEEIIHITQNVTVIESISALIHQLQKEGNAAQILAINQQRDRVDIIDQEERTDKSIADLQKVCTKYKYGPRELIHFLRFQYIENRHTPSHRLLIKRI